MIITDMTKIGDPQILLWEDTYYCYATYTDGKQPVFAAVTLPLDGEGSASILTIVKEK